MAHELIRQPGAAAPLRLNSPIDEAALARARVDMAACLRMAARLGFAEGICNHFSALVPGRDDLFLVNPYGLAFAEVTASSLLVCDFDGNVIRGEGTPEATAFYIHARLHLNKPGAAAAFHTHMPNATALTMIEGGASAHDPLAHDPLAHDPLAYAGQSALKFLGRVAVDPVYNGLALDAAEGDRIAAAMGEADILFMRNHGVMVTGPSIAEAWDDLYYLERAAEVQIRALSTGRPLLPVPEAVARTTARQMRDGDAESARLHLESVKRILARSEPDFAS